MNITFEQAYFRYLEYARLRQKPTSLLTFKRKMERNFLPYFGKIKIRKLNVQEYANWQIKIAEKGYSYTYKRNLHYCICAFYNYLINFYGIKKNIPKIVGNFKDNYLKNVKSDYWTYEEYKKFISCVDNPVYYAFFKLLFFTGLRKGEALALTFNDLEDNFMSITKTISKEKFNGQRIIMIPKTKKSIRKIQIDSELKNDINNLRNYYIKKYDNFNNNFFIFGASEPLSTTTLERKKNYYCDKANVKRITIHDFRHSHATLLYQLGIPILTISNRLGHSSIETTVSVYIHENNENEKRAIELLSSLK